MYKFSFESQKRLNTVHPKLRAVIESSLKYSILDFGVSEGHRSLEKQKMYYENGATKVLEGKHNKNPSEAVDLYIWIDGRISWERHDYCYLAGVILTMAKIHGVKVRWGGNFDLDGEILEQKFNDLVHFELY
tara:strand:+ start:218 stop:613 length:396 start_codon:yes stop_codon:yes gene_type:complete